VCDLILPRGLAFRTFKHHMYLCPDGPSRAAISEGPGFTCRYSLVEILVSEIVERGEALDLIRPQAMPSEIPPADRVRSAIAMIERKRIDYEEARSLN
jgi:hypothetical protein